MEDLSTYLDIMGLSMPLSLQKKALDFLRFLMRWNRSHNLTAMSSFDRMLVYHLLDSLSIAPYLHGKKILDVGTGAGFPGLPLALYYPDKTFTLLDSNEKKTRFLIQMKSMLNINNIQIVRQRVENYRVNVSFDNIVFRALGLIPDVINYSEHLCHQEGQFLAMKSHYPSKELSGICRSFVVKQLTVPRLEAERHLVLVDGLTRA